MLSLNDNFVLKCIAWFLQFPFYILWFIIKFFLNKTESEHDRIQAPQYPKTIVITGASQGIGEGLVEYYYKNCSSCRTIIMISRNKEKLDNVKKRLEIESEKKIITYTCDVIDADAMKRILLEIHQIYGQVDILFANAGISFRQHHLKNSFDKAVRDTFNVNINGVLNTIMPLIDIQGVRQIAIVSSQAAYAPFVSFIYGTTKQCVLSLGRELRRHLAPQNIVVNIISPGPVVTPMLVGSRPNSVSRGVSVEKAASIIYEGLRCNHAEIVFPPSTGIFVYILSFLPLHIAETIKNYIIPEK